MGAVEPIDQNILFAKKETLSGYCDHAKNNAKQKISDLTFDEIKDISEQEIVCDLYERYKTEPPTINTKPEDCSREKSDDIIVYHIPFTGDKELFDLIPASEWKPVGGPYGTIKNNEIIIKYSLRDDVELIKEEFNSNYLKIIKNLEDANKTCVEHNELLKNTIKEYVSAKYKELYKTDEKFKNL